MSDPVARPPHESPFEASDPYGQASPYGSPNQYGPQANSPQPAGQQPNGLPPTRQFEAADAQVYGDSAGDPSAPRAASSGQADPSPHAAAGPPAAPRPPTIYGSPAAVDPYYAPAPGEYGTPTSHNAPPTYGSFAAPATYGSPAAAPFSSPAAPNPFASVTKSDPYHQNPGPYGAAGAYGSGAPGQAPNAYGAPVPPYGSQLQPYQQPALQPYGMPVPHHRLVPPGGRLGAALLDSLLVLVTLGIGWMIWALIVWSNGLTPAKQLLGHVVADATTGAPLGWGRMFVREILIRSLLFVVINVVTAGIFGLVNACMVFRQDHRTLHDQMAGSIVRYA